MILKESLKTIAVSLIILSLVGVVYAWTEPTQIAPLGNTAPPISTDAVPQIKSGGLDLGSLTVSGKSMFNNKVGIMTGLVPSDTDPALVIGSATDEILKFTRQGVTQPTTFRTGTDGALVINNGGKDVINIDKDGNFTVKVSAYDNQGFFNGQPNPRCPGDNDINNIDEVRKFITSDPIDSICYDWGKDQGVSKSRLFKVLNQNSTDLLSLSPNGLVVKDAGLTVEGPITTSPGGFIFPDGKAQTMIPMSGYERIVQVTNDTMDTRAICSSGKIIISGGCNGARNWKSIISSWPDTEFSWRCISSDKVYPLYAYAICANIEGQTGLFDNNHSELACTVAGGSVDTTSDPGKSFCKFNTSSCPSGWTQYNNWSATSANTCTGTSVYRWYIALQYQGSNWVPPESCLGTSTTSGQPGPTQHSWSNNDTLENSTYDNGVCTTFGYYESSFCATCSTNTATCSATRTQIGCY